MSEIPLVIFTCTHKTRKARPNYIPEEGATQLHTRGRRNPTSFHKEGATPISSTPSFLGRFPLMQKAPTRDAIHSLPVSLHFPLWNRPRFRVSHRHIHFESNPHLGSLGSPSCKPHPLPMVNKWQPFTINVAPPPLHSSLSSLSPPQDSNSLTFYTSPPETRADHDCLQQLHPFTL